MSDLEEMAKELARAIELNDIPAAEMIAHEMYREAQSLELGDLGGHLLEAIQRCRYSEALVYSASLGRKAAQIDLENGRMFGSAFLAGDAFIKSAQGHLAH